MHAPQNDTFQKLLVNVLFQERKSGSYKVVSIEELENGNMKLLHFTKGLENHMKDY